MAATNSTCKTWNISKTSRKCLHSYFAVDHVFTGTENEVRKHLREAVITDTFQHDYIAEEVANTTRRTTIIAEREYEFGRKRYKAVTKKYRLYQPIN